MREEHKKRKKRVNEIFIQWGKKRKGEGRRKRSLQDEINLVFMAVQRFHSKEK